MKSLIFNGLIISAMVYLLAGGNTPQALTDGAKRVVNVTRDLAVTTGLVKPAIPTRKRERIFRPNGKQATATPPRPGQPPETVARQQRPATGRALKTAPEADPARPRPRAKIAAPAMPAAPRWEDGTKTVPVTDPVIARRRAEVLNEAPKPVTSGSKNPPQFMKPRQRRRELERLAEEMELMFAEKLSR